MTRFNSFDGGSTEGVSMTIRNSAAGSAAFVLLYVLNNAADAQTYERLPDVVVTADRVPEPIARTGSAISVVGSDTIETSNSGSLVDSLRSVPGLDITETGGPGATTNVRLRGGNTGQTLVMIDGIRVNDPANAAGDFDFALIAPSAIDRVEVLKGPQSALYGSDAIGGVINIITKKGSGPSQFNVRTEAGSYGTVATAGSLIGSTGPWSYAFTGSGTHSNGFSRYGYRIPSLEARFPNLERDGFDRVGGSARVTYDAGEGVRLESGILSSFTRAAFDAASGAFPDTPSSNTRLLQQVWGRATVESFGGILTHSFNVFDTRTERNFQDVSYRINQLPANTNSTLSDFLGNSLGAEYQGTLKMGLAGSLVFGGKAQRETAETYQAGLLPAVTPRTQQLGARQDTNALFGLWSLPIGERLIVTLGGRVDDVVDVARFETWRTTAAYLIPETGTKLRASAGTGAKAPTLFQLFAPTFGNAALRPEESFGYDAGIDQTIFNGRVTLSLTGFSNSFSNLIDFNTTAMRYFNVSRAETNGIEVGADIDVIPGFARVKAAYTHLHAIDLATGLTLARRPADFARVALTMTPTPQWTIEPRVTAVSKRFSGSNETSPLDPYVRFDVYTEYRIDPIWKVFARGENIFDARYQEVLNYGTTGAAVYAGVNAAW